RMPWTTDCLCVAIHHLAKGLHAGSQAKQREARRNLRQGLKLQRPRRNRSRCSKLVHGVAFLCGIITPSLAAQGEQRRFSYFNIERDNSLLASTSLIELNFPTDRVAECAASLKPLSRSPARSYWSGCSSGEYLAISRT